MMKEILATELFYDAVVSLFTSLRDEKLFYEQLIVQGGNLVQLYDGFLYVVEKENDQLAFACGIGTYAAKKDAFLRYDWGVPLYVQTRPVAFLGFGSAEQPSQISKKRLDLLSRFAVVASEAFYYKDIYQCSPEEPHNDEEKKFSLYDQGFYITQILHYNKHRELVDELMRDRQPAGAALPFYAMASAGEERQLSPPVVLSEREKQVLFLIAQGCSNADIARQMHFSQGSVKYHLGHIFTKLGVKNRIQALVSAHRQGLI